MKSWLYDYIYFHCHTNKGSTIMCSESQWVYDVYECSTIGAPTQ